jgi:hypothetical protein
MKDKMSIIYLQSKLAAEPILYKVPLTRFNASEPIVALFF